MVVHRMLTTYRKVRDQTENDEDDDGIELLQHRRETCVADQHWFDSTDESQPRITMDSESDAVGEFHASQDEGFHAPSGFIGQVPQGLAQRKLLSGWRVGVLFSLAGATAVFVFNLAMTVYVWTGPYKRLDDSVGTLFQGSCARTRTLDVWIHLIVNVLSTLLLSASNYAMQVLSAPNREELVRAHAKRVWLHIGVPSLHNLRHIGRARVALWFALFLSSMPLHLLFNSVVFTNMQANEYIVVPTTQDWLDGAAYNTTGFINVNSSATEVIAETIDRWRFNTTNNTATNYRRLEAADCYAEYNNQYISGAGNLYIVQDGATVWRDLSIWWPQFHSNNSFTWNRTPGGDLPREDRDLTEYAAIPFSSTPDFYPSNGWRCPSQTVKTCDVSNTYEVPSNKSEWQPFGAPIKYCMVEQVEERCRLHFSFSIAVLVIVCNFVKAVCMALTLFMYRRHLPLVTMGDTVAHFLDHPDPETKGRCLFTKKLMEAQWTWEQTNSARKDELGVAPERFDPRRQLWQTAPSPYRWFGTYVLYVAAIIVGIVCMVFSLAGMPKDPAKLWKVGFGTITGNNLMSISTSILGGILLANTPQAALSYLYLAFNALYTNMFVAREWSGYMDERKPLRVTSPVGQQRDTYWLNVPFRWAVPMTVLSGLFHWLASQSIFLVQITITSAASRESTRQISTCGYSPVAIILCTVVGSVMAIGGIVIGRFRYAAGMPVASSCSAAISAACHPLPEERHASMLPVQWGAVTHGKRGADEKEPVGHCSFSSFPVERPVRGRLYA